MIHPYTGLPGQSFWSTGVVAGHPLQPVGLYKKKFSIGPNDRIATAGSCFAQHISRHLRASGYTVLDVEPPPPNIPQELARRFGYLTYSARYGNLYTTRQLLQLAQEALLGRDPGEVAWGKGDRYHDALRPAVEPDGLASPDDVLIHRQHHIRKVRTLLETCTVFVFTLGLTETWQDIETGTVYPTAPGTIAGKYDPKRVKFKNLRFAESLEDFHKFRALIKTVNPEVRFLVTVSPVSLNATASAQHVLPATIYSKSVLRAVAGDLYNEFEDVDYFPSYEIVASHPSRGFFYESNLREVNAAGVEVVMKAFLEEHVPLSASSAKKKKTSEDVICEEALLEAFAP